MAVRYGSALDITVARAFVDRYLVNADAYLEAKRELAARVQHIATALGFTPRVLVNAADAPKRNSYYLTVTGTSAESGDDGQVGRGNRANGLITPYRPMSLEAVAGKNPSAHVGKLYNIVAKHIAERLCIEVDQVSAATCFLVSQIGKPIAHPELVHVKLYVLGGHCDSSRQATVGEIVERELSRIPELTLELVRGELDIF